MLDPNKYVAPEKRPIAKPRLRETLAAAHQTIAGQPPNYARLRAAWCQICLETGGGRAAWNHNLGNIKTSKTDSWDGYWTDLTSILPAGSKEWPFQRAYVDHLSAANDYWRLMLARYSSSLEVADSGDLMAFARRLREQGYFTADATAYGEALTRWALEYDSIWPAPGGGPWDRFGQKVYSQGLLVIAALAVGAAIWWESRT